MVGSEIDDLVKQLLRDFSIRVVGVCLVIPQAKALLNQKVIVESLLSAYEVKNNSCLFEGLFKVKKNGVFLFGISFFVLEIFTFLYYANEGSDDVIDRSTKTIQH